MISVLGFLIRLCNNLLWMGRLLNGCVCGCGFLWYFELLTCCYKSHVMTKPVLCYIRTTKMQIGLGMPAVWSVSLFIVHCLDSTTFCTCYIQSFKTLASFWSRAGHFESHPVANAEERFSRDKAQLTHIILAFLFLGPRQTVQTHIRRRKTGHHLIRVYTVC